MKKLSPSYIYKQIYKIRQNPYFELNRILFIVFLKSLNKLNFLFNGIWAIPAVFIIRFLKRWLIIRMGTFNSDRIGHFVPEAGIKWSQILEKPHNQLDLFWLPKRTCNSQWSKMVRRNFKVYWFVYFLDSWNKFLPGGEIHQKANLNRCRDTEGSIARSKSKIDFLPKEDEIGENWLKKFGWCKGDPFVCLLVRDSAYLEKESSLKGNWDYHNYRDTNIDTYVPAVEWLANQGILVFRMGKFMKKPLTTANSNIIDYAFHRDKCDFLDIWLFANCSLCITTGTGPDQVSQIYKRPLLMLNYIPIRGLWSWCEATTVPKHLIWEKSGKELSLVDHLEHPFAMTQDYQKAKIRIEDLNEKEILEAVMEKWSRLEGTWEHQEGDKERQAEFWRLLKDCKEYKRGLYNIPSFSNQFGFIHPNARFGYSFLRKNPEFLEI